MSTSAATPAAPLTPIAADGRVVLVGGGLAAVTAATTLRTLGHAGPIVLVSDESVAPYDRPPLSKDVLTGAIAEPGALLTPERAAELDVELVLGDAAVAIDPEAHTLTLATGRVLEFDRAVLATGADARALPVPGADLAGVHTLRTRDDASACLAAAQNPGPVVVIGGGFIGLEVAGAFAKSGRAVTVVEAGPTVLGRVVPAEVAEEVAARHAAAGIALEVGAGVVALEADGSGRVGAVVLSDGRSLPACLVVVGIGAVPSVDLAESAGLALAAPEHGGGVLVDEAMRTSHPDVLAAGDVAAVAVGEGSRRTEQWQDAQTEGAVAAHTVLGLAAPVAPVGWFWSDQGDLALQVAGDLDGELVVERSDDRGGRTWFHLAADGSLRGAVTVDRVPDVRGAIAVMELGATVAPEVLADPGQDLRRLARALKKG